MMKEKKQPTGNRRRKSREFALQALYQWQLASPGTAELEQQYRAAEGFSKADPQFFLTLVTGAIQIAPDLQEKMAAYLDRTWQEISPIERGILLLAGYELIMQPATPYRVIINEAIELAKSYGGTEGHKYVNGVLDKLAAAVRAEEIARPRA